METLKDCIPAKVKKVTTERCLEMIADLEKTIKSKFGKSYEYTKEEKELLIAEMKKNPTHCWWVGENSLEHGSMETTVVSIVSGLI